MINVNEKTLSKILKIFNRKLLFEKIDQNFKSFFPDTFFGIFIYFNFLKLINLFSFNERKNIFKKNFRKVSQSLKILNHDGYKVFRLKKNSLKETIEKINFKKIIDRDLKSKKEFLKSYSIDLLDEEFYSLKKIILSKEFLTPIINYIGSVPLLWKCEFWLSPNKSFETGRSQEFHLDGEDLKQVKCFIPIENITKDSGPLNIIDAKNSRLIFKELKKKKKINYRYEKVPDEEMYKVFNKKNKITLEAEIGDVIMLDTSNCYHYGSRPGKKIRKLIFLQFFSINSKELSIFKSFKTKKYELINEQLLHFHILNN